MTETKIQKSVKIIVDISTDPRVRGRYFAQLVDTTHGTANQLTTRVRDLDEIREFIDSVKAQAEPRDIRVDVEDRTGELDI
jgi:hypothetical protein